MMKKSKKNMNPGNSSCNSFFVKKKEPDETNSSEDVIFINEIIPQDLHIICESEEQQLPPAENETLKTAHGSTNSCSVNLHQSVNVASSSSDGCKKKSNVFKQIDNLDEIFNPANPFKSVPSVHADSTLNEDELKSRNKNYKCTKCEKEFTSIANLRRHISTIHFKERPYKCDKYGKTFTRKDHLKDHHFIHTELPYKCNKCKQGFDLKASFDDHLNHAHSKEEKPFEALTEQQNLKTPKRGKEHKCNVCEKSFYHKHHKEAHLRVHTGERPFKCQECPKAFTSQWALVEHRRVHTGEKPHKCEICEKTFRIRSILNYHMKTRHV